MDSPDEIRYRRSRFSTRLPTDRRYTRSHFWVREVKPGVWQVGFTQFAIRMLGEFVELGFEVKTGEALTIGQVIGQVEGFKAITDLFSVIEGVFLGMNPALEHDIVLADTHPYHQGWLYQVQGVPEAEAVSVEEYVAILDETISKMTDDYPTGDGSE